MKDYNNNFSPLEEKDNFIWVAEYDKKDNMNRSYISELSFYNPGFGLIPHTFDEIDKNLISYLGYIGRGYKFFYDIKTGVFNIFNTLFTTSYFDYDSGIEYKFMNHPDTIYNDIIIFKTVANDVTITKETQQATSKLSTLVYGVGYKTKINFINVKNIFNLSMDIKKVGDKYIRESPYFKFKLTSAKSMDGEFRIYMNDKLTTVMKTPLKANYGKTFKIKIS